MFINSWYLDKEQLAFFILLPATTCLFTGYTHSGRWFKGAWVDTTAASEFGCPGPIS
jgi:hypothetical protein